MSDTEYNNKKKKNNQDTVTPLDPPKPKKKTSKKRHSAPATLISKQTAKVKKNKDREHGVNIKSPNVSNRINAELKTNNNNEKSKVIIRQKYDVLPELKRGTALLKYGRRGYPHFRQFNISDDHEYLIWFSSKKSETKSTVHVSKINDVITGQHTKQFQRIGWNTLTPASFSIIYNNKKDSLNLVAKSVDEMKMWVESLRLLRDLSKKGENLRKLKKLEVEVDFRDRNRPQSRNHSGNFLRSHETKDHAVDPVLKKKLISDLDSLKKLFNDVNSEANQSKAAQNTQEWESIAQILSETQERIEELEHEVANTRNTKIAENDVWRTRVDLESIHEKIKVLNKRSKKSDGKRRWSVFNT